MLKWATADMGAYLMQRRVGSEVRERLQAPLKSALRRKDDICLMAHSMGCIVAYDVLWKFSQMSEYREFQTGAPGISLWLTLGCPLGEAGVKANLYDANEREDGRFPKKIVKNWVNIAAVDDFIAHDVDMRNDFSAMLPGKRGYGYVRSIKDKRIYNCWTHEGKSNPHKLYGYLVNHDVARELANWIRA